MQQKKLKSTCGHVQQFKPSQGAVDKAGMAHSNCADERIKGEIS